MVLAREKYGGGMHDVMLSFGVLSLLTGCSLALMLPVLAFSPEWDFGDWREAVLLLILTLSITASLASSVGAR